MNSDEPVEQAPTEHVAPAGDVAKSPRWGRRLEAWGWFALVLGWVLVLGAPGGLLGKVADTEGGIGGPVFWTGFVFAVIAGLVLVVLGSWAVRRGRRHLQRVLPALSTDLPAERIVLFLRAFSDDAQFARTAGSRLLRWLLWLPPATPGDLRTEEEQVARGVAPFGRMVALGRPSERLPRSGAERSYASDELWRSEVLAGLDRANLVLLSAGPGENLRWEVEQAVRRDDPTRLALVITRNPQSYADFRAAVGNLFPNGLPEDPRERGSRTRSVRAVVWFEPDWTPRWEPLTGRFPLFRSKARTQHALPRALHRVYERAGVRAPSRDSPSLPRPRAVATAVALCSAWMLLSTALTVVILGGLLVLSSHESVGVAIVIASVLLGLTALLLWAWMRRVLRGGPVAFLLFQATSVVPNVQPLAAVFVLGTAAWAGESDVGVVLAVLAGVNTLVLVAVLPFVVGKFVFDRDVRAWLDSRN